MDPFLSLVGVHPRGLNGSQAADSSLVDLADHASEVILKDGSADEIHLIGFSAAGVFAWETARALQAKGASPRSLVMIDTRCGYDRKPSAIRRTVRSLRKGAIVKAANLVGNEITSAFQMGKNKANVREAHSIALAGADLKPLDLDQIFLVRASRGPLSNRDIDQWHRLAENSLTVAELPGDHMSVLRGDGASEIAHRVAEWLP